MKLTYIISLLVLLASCATVHQYPVASDYDTRGQFGSYETYKIVNNPALPAYLGETVSTGIRRSLNAMGYEEVESSPSLYLYFQVFTEDVELRSHEQAPLANMVSRKGYFEDQTTGSKEVVKKISGPSLLVALFDPTLEITVWRGYGHLHPKGLNAKASTQMIMREFPIFPESFLSREEQFALR